MSNRVTASLFLALVEGHCDLLIVKGRILMALVLIRLGGSSLAFYKEHIVLFRPVLPHPSSELRAIFFWIPYSLRNLLLKFQNFSQSVEPAGIRFNRSH